MDYHGYKKELYDDGYWWIKKSKNNIDEVLESDLFNMKFKDIKLRFK